jgi:hypothetical protein
METIIAMQKPEAIITNKARILRREMFRIALDRTPNYFTRQAISEKRQPKRGMLKNGKWSAALLDGTGFARNSRFTCVS